MSTHRRLLALAPARLWLALGVLVVGLLLAYLVGAVNRRLLRRAGVPEAIEGTAFERTARDLGTSTVDIVARLGTYFVVGFTIIVALTVAQVRYTTLFWNRVAAFLPPFFFALAILVAGVVVGDKVELLVAERLRGVKVPQVGVLPTLAKVTVVYVAVLVALGQVGVATAALVVLLAGYLLAVIVFGGLAFRDLLASGAAGVFLLLREPYGIGDEIRLGDRRGVVQEVDVFITRIEVDGEEHILPNRTVLKEGIVRVR